MIKKTVNSLTHNKMNTFGLKTNFLQKSVMAVLIFLTILTLIGSCDSPQQDEDPHIVFLISEDPNNYEAHKTIPKFADMLSSEYDYETSVLLGTGDRNSFEFPNLEKELPEADLLVVFFRRIALKKDQLNLIKDHLEQGKPLVGIRTANHAFSVRGGEIPAGYEQWWEFVPEVLGVENRGYGPAELGTDVAVTPAGKNHPTLKDVHPTDWHSTGNVYHVAPMIDQKATVLLTGTVKDKTEPIAWTRKAGNSRIFYTSLGYPDDFETPQFKQLLINGINWTLQEDK
jgi:type 1 glutamine amidotransferase